MSCDDAETICFLFFNLIQAHDLYMFFENCSFPATRATKR